MNEKTTMKMQLYDLTKQLLVPATSSLSDDPVHEPEEVVFLIGLKSS